MNVFLTVPNDPDVSERSRTIPNVFRTFPNVPNVFRTFVPMADRRRMSPTVVERSILEVPNGQNCIPGI